jgi:transcriptional regulator with XRE-family HTH domain
LLGTTVQNARLAAGLKVGELAQELNLSSQYVSVIERGQRRPDAPVLIRIAGVLQLDVRPLMELAGHSLEATAWPARVLVQLAFSELDISEDDATWIRISLRDRH